MNNLLFCSNKGLSFVFLSVFSHIVVPFLSFLSCYFQSYLNSYKHIIT